MLDGTKVLKEVWGSNTLIPLYDNEDSVCGIVYNGEPYYFVKNLQGDVIAIVDEDVETVAKYSYDAWGVPEVKSDTSEIGIATINPYRYRGYYYDNEIGMYYLQSRYYNPVVGRFVNADDVKIILSVQTILAYNDDQVYNNRIVIDEMKIKNGRYVSKGISSLCDLNDEDRIENLPIETTKTMNGHVSWSVLYSREEAEKLPNVASINS